MLGLIKSEKVKSIAKIKQVEVVLGLMQKYRQFLVYGIIGGSGATLDLIIFLILFNVFHIDKNVATAISTSLGITNNFILNAIFNFKVKDNLLRRYFSFYLVGLSGLAITLLIFYICVDLLKFDANIIKFVTILVVIPIQYFSNKTVSFRKR